jgi:hypothetical protein
MTLPESTAREGATCIIGDEPTTLHNLRPEHLEIVQRTMKRVITVYVNDMGTLVCNSLENALIRRETVV